MLMSQNVNNKKVESQPGCNNNDNDNNDNDNNNKLKFFIQGNRISYKNCYKRVPCVNYNDKKEKGRTLKMIEKYILKS